MGKVNLNTLHTRRFWKKPNTHETNSKRSKSELTYELQKKPENNYPRKTLKKRFPRKFSLKHIDDMNLYMTNPSCTGVFFSIHGASTQSKKLSIWSAALGDENIWLYKKLSCYYENMLKQI